MINRAKLVCIGFIQIISLAVLAEEIPFHFADGITLDLSYVKSSVQSKNWYVFLTGSTCKFHRADEFSRVLLSQDDELAFNYLIVNKVGTVAKSWPNDCEKSIFNDHFLRAERIERVIEVLKQFVPPDAEIILVGGSEGAYLAPEVAFNMNDSRIKAVIMLSGGTRNWFEEESARSLSNKEFLDKNILGNPDPKQFFLGWSYLTWNSFRELNTLQALKNLTIPVQMINGDMDHSVWMPGVLEDAYQLQLTNPNFKFHLLRGVGHGLGCVDKTICDSGANYSVVKSLRQNFVKKVLIR
ncbi:MAG: hypothetical protein V4736_15435 [Bdellovibrionota bacterium]